MSDSSKSSSGISLGSLVFVVFLALKLTHVIAWSWWWITAPLWAPTILFFLILGVGAVVIFRDLLFKQAWKR